MDWFDDDRPELTRSLISMEFVPGERISQLCASDPALPDEGDDFQFVLQPDCDARRVTSCGGEV